MLADQLHSDVAAAFERNVGEFSASCFFNGHCDDLVFLFRTGPPILNLLGPAALTASRYSFAVLCGESALTHSTNWSSASMATGVMSFQLNGTPVASGVVNRFDSVMIILLGSPLASLTARNPSAPAPPDLLTTINGCFIRLFLVMTPCSRRAIWSAPPPVPAGTTNSTGLVGSQPAVSAGELANSAPTANMHVRAGRDAVNFFILSP